MDTEEQKTLKNDFALRTMEEVKLALTGLVKDSEAQATYELRDASFRGILQGLISHVASLLECIKDDKKERAVNTACTRLYKEAMTGEYIP